MNKKQVLITDHVHQCLIDGFRSDGYDVTHKPKMSLQEVHDVIHLYEGVIVNSKIICKQELIDKATKLEFIGRLGSGLEIIDLDYAASKNIAVHSAPEGNCNAVAEHAMAMLLTLFNKINLANAEVKAFGWNREKNRGTELSGMTVGILGFGHTGSSFAKKLTGFDVKVLAYDKYKTDYTDGFDYVKESTPEEIQRESDVISFHLPLTEETHFLVNQDYLMSCKDGVYIINTCRGKVLKLEDLLFALSIKKVAGACLDVFENEKFETVSLAEKVVLTKLFQLDNVIVTPHVAGWTHESLRKIAETLLLKIRRQS